MLTHALLLLTLVAPDARLIDTISVDAVMGHLRAFQSIADRHGGNRAAGLPGYDASADYVAARLREAGYTVELQPFTFEFFREIRPALLKGRRAFKGVTTLRFSGSGDVTGRPVGAGDGCQAADFGRAARRAVGVVSRGSCSFRVKAEHAARAGVAALVVANQRGEQGTFKGSLVVPQRLPVVGVSHEAGRQVLRQGGVRVVTRTRTDRRTTRNVIAQTAATSPGRVVMAGAHLDSVPEGPGINDNASGSAALLELAIRLGRTTPERPVRFAWWGAEEQGLIGSKHYVARLSERQRERIEVYLNFDMIGSPNHTYAIFDGDDSDKKGAKAGPPGSARAERYFQRYFDARGLPHHGTDFKGNSDYDPFLKAGIAVGGLFTGAGDLKTAEEARRYGGTAGRAKDPCYHEACDKLANVNEKVLEATSNAMAHVVSKYAWPRT
ncbi:M20/M25/M40 family metallo-hydrolase [Nonomuraea sp. NN258]|uniref:M20/M25/M40 family metallo-hydrolase n=1 Tax=Nonomuraea antri TaxID=2730852 RepID=UPI001568FABF|nr:M20/M25/M40 family metallo-hydrolase [Nonomuraea antri]NRQ34065.1 M20/M25/M40 family metallo-hydrolase [Nonomuraea antri]